MEMPLLLHSTFPIVYWVSLAAGMSFQVPRNAFFSMAPGDGADDYNVSSRAVVLTILREEDVKRGNAGKVEDVNAALDCNL